MVIFKWLIKGVKRWLMFWIWSQHSTCSSANSHIFKSFFKKSWCLCKRRWFNDFLFECKWISRIVLLLLSFPFQIKKNFALWKDNEAYFQSRSDLSFDFFKCTTITQNLHHCIHLFYSFFVLNDEQKWWIELKWHLYKVSATDAGSVNTFNFNIYLFCLTVIKCSHQCHNAKRY